MRRSNIWIIKLIACLLCGICGIASMTADDKEAVKKKMLEIKLNEDFIFGEGTSDNKDLAYGDALEDLLAFANEIKNMNSQEEIKINDLITNVETIVYEDGSRYEVMVFIPFKIVIETNSQTSSAQSSAKMEVKKFKEETPSPASEPPAPTALSQKEIVEEPVETPKVEGTPEESIANDDTTSMEITGEVIAETVNRVTPEIIEEIKQSEPEITAEQPTEIIETEPIVAANVESQPIVVSEKNETKTESPAPAFTSQMKDDDIEEFLITQENFAEIKSYLSEMKRSGKITETGASEGLTGVPEDASLILIDELGGILSILSPVSEKSRVNYKTKKSDSEKNYNSKFIVWYRK